MSFTRLLVALAVTTFSLSLSSAFADEDTVKGDIYKCTTDAGVISYLETKPATGCASVEIVRINTGKGSAGAHQGNRDSDNESAMKAQDKREIDERKNKGNEACETKKTNLNILKTSTAVKVKDADGNAKALSSEEIQQQIKDIEQYINDFCSK